MYCVKCGQQIPDNSDCCNICGYKQVYIVRHISDDPYQIAIETNDRAVIEKCKEIHTQCNYKLEKNEDQSNITQEPNMYYFLTYRISEIPILKALFMSLKELLFKHRAFDRILENFLFQNGYQKLPGEDTVYMKKN